MTMRELKMGSEGVAWASSVCGRRFLAALEDEVGKSTKKLILVGRSSSDPNVVAIVSRLDALGEVIKSFPGKDGVDDD